MDLNDTQPSRKAPNSAAFPSNTGDDHKEVAWAFLGLILWSGVILGGLFGAGYILGHSILHLW
jgi:hypothetical protein